MTQDGTTPHQTWSQPSAWCRTPRHPGGSRIGPRSGSRLRNSTGDKWAFGTGYIFRSAAELFLIGTRGKPAQKVRNERNLIAAPVREHSRKPDAMYTKIEALWDGPYVELFSRSSRPCWHSWGAEAGKFKAAA